MASVNMPQKQDPMEKLVRGLQVAQSVFGIYSGYQGMKNRQEQEKDLANNVVNASDKATLLSKGFVPAEGPSADTVAFNEKTQEGLKPVYFKLPQKQQESAQAKVYEYEDAQGRKRAGKTVNGEVIVSASDKIIGYPKKEAGKGPEGGKMPTAVVAGEIGDAESALGTLDILTKAWGEKASSTGSGAASMLPWSQSRQYKDQLKQAAQGIGRYLEGGKMTDADVVRYEAMLPGPWDTPERAANKINSMQSLIESKRKGQVSGLQQSGFDVSGYRSLPQKRVSVGGETSPGVSLTGTAVAAPVQEPPMTVRQNGVLYRFNPKTRQYE